MTVDYHDRIFAGVENSANGEVGGETRFHYRQEGTVLWGTYQGGGIAHGHLVGRVLPGGALDFRYHHLSPGGEAVSGHCRSELTILKDGRYRLAEKWRWTSGDLSSGESVVEEVRADR